MTLHSFNALMMMLSTIASLGSCAIIETYPRWPLIFLGLVIFFGIQIIVFG